MEPSQRRPPDARTQELIRRRAKARRRRIRLRQVGIAGAIIAVAALVIAGVAWVNALEPRDAEPNGGASATANSSPVPSSSTLGNSPERTSPRPAATPVTTGGSPLPSSAPKPAFQVAGALRDVRVLEHIGVRSGGSAAEERGALYIADRLKAAGIADVKIRTFLLPPVAKTSRNVIAVIPGENDQTIVLGAHMDSKYPSPGANDNGSGCAALLEIARCLAARSAYPTVKLVFFGTEEMVDADPDHHHFGSRAFVAGMSETARRNIAGMISVDMIGFGPAFVVRSMGRGPQSMVRLLQQQAGSRHIDLSYLSDPGPSGYSDHEAFELDDIPAAWIEWRDDPAYHTSADTSGHVVAAKVRQTGQFLLDVLYGMDDTTLRRLSL